jgi:hypothetical protein
MNKWWTLISIATLLFSSSGVQGPPSVNDPLPLVVSFIFGTMTAVLVFTLTYRKEQQALLRQKLEDLFVAVQKCGMVLTESVEHYIDGKTVKETLEEITKGEADDRYITLENLKELGKPCSLVSLTTEAL